MAKLALELAGNALCAFASRYRWRNDFGSMRPVCSSRHLQVAVVFLYSSRLKVLHQIKMELVIFTESDETSLMSNLFPEVL